MYSAKPNILQLIALLKSHGIRQAVLCPGSRNAPLVQSLAVDRHFECHSATDERSAGFYAIGLAQATGQAVAVCCTSGSAVVNLYPAVAEAYYQNIPLIVISADRPRAWIGQMDGQTMPQSGVFAPLVRYSASLGEGYTEEDLWHINRQINEALLCVQRDPSGPVHINVPLSEPLFDFSAEHLPEVRTIRRYTLDDRSESLGLATELSQCRRIMLVLGQTSLGADALLSAIESLPSSVVLVKEHLATGVYSPERWVQMPDALIASLPDAVAESLAPDLLITLGGHIVSKRFKQYLRTHRPRAHWHISPRGEIIDLYQALTAVIEADEVEAIRHIGRLFSQSAATEYASLWQSRASSLPEPCVGYSGLQAVGRLIHQIPEGSALHLANSSSVRYAGLFALPRGIRVLCNRGINGIEGTLSVALGHARATSSLDFIVIGDLSFFYDMNALTLANISNSVRILLLNNQGGGIFHSVAGLNQPKTQLDPIVGVHNHTARLWANSCGLVYKSVHKAEQLPEAIDWLCRESSEHPLVVEVFTTMQEDTNELNRYYQQLKQV